MSFAAHINVSHYKESFSFYCSSQQKLSNPVKAIFSYSWPQ